MTHYAVTDPATGERVREYPTATDHDIDDALAVAAAAWRTWSRRTTVADRAAAISRVADLHRQRANELGEIIRREMGKPVAEGAAEAEFAADIYAYYAQHAAEFLADRPIALRAGSGTAAVRHSPFGVVLGIMPWNFPYYQVARFAAPNVCTGNPVILKHAPQCPESAAAIADLFGEAGLGAAYTNVYATNDQVAAMIADPRVAGVSLTGSERAGARVAEIAGRHLKKVVLELGGSDAFIVLSTDAMDRVVEQAVAARLDNVGQACNAAKRFIVIGGLYDEFVAKFTALMLARAAALAPLASVAAADRLRAQIDAAEEGGATVVRAGRTQGATAPVAVLTDVAEDNPVFGQELFGPVAMVFRAIDERDAVRLANDSPYGLGSYVFTLDRRQASRVADALDVGMVFINGVLADSPELPFGGVKRSGFGRELGASGINEFMNKKLIRVVG